MSATRERERERDRVCAYTRERERKREDRFQRVPRRRRAPSGGGKGREGRAWTAPRSEVNLSENALGTRAFRFSPSLSVKQTCTRLLKNFGNSPLGEKGGRISPGDEFRALDRQSAAEETP